MKDHVLFFKASGRGHPRFQSMFLLAKQLTVQQLMVDRLRSRWVKMPFQDSKKA